MGRLGFSLLGTPETRHGGALLGFPTRKTHALLIYLAVEGGRHTRDKLIALLWPDSDQERGRRSLRTALTFLRHALAGSAEAPPHLLVDREALALATNGDVERDLDSVEAAFQLARGPAQHPPGELIARLRDAARLCRGEFLHGFSLGDALAFDEWASVQREAWHRRADLIFDRLSRALSEGGERLEAVEVTASWVALDPLNEVAHRRLMQLYAAAGDRAAALRAYQACRTVLAQELNADPSTETEALVARVRAEAVAPGESDPAGEPAIPAAAVDLPLVGRLAEHAQLVAAYRIARRGQPQVAIIEGEPGIGKSRLATEFLRWAASQGADILQGRAFETAGRLPYQAVVDALRGRLARDDPFAPAAGKARQPPLSDVWLAELSRILPELRERTRPLPAPLLVGEPEARTRLYEAVTRLGARLAARTPVILFVDDVQWADVASLDLLQYAAHRWAGDGARILILAGVRTDHLHADPALEGWVAGLARALSPVRIALGPLTAGDTERIAQILGLGPIASWLVAETGGHPLYLVETLKALGERGLISRDAAGHWSVPDEPAASWGSELSGFLPAGVQALIHARLARLGSEARDVLAAAAVLGDGCAFDELGAVVAQPDGSALVALEALLARRLVRESGHRYFFWHDKIREVAYLEMAEARRGLYHRRALESLATHPVPVARLARHALAAGLGEPAFRYSLLAGDEAMRLFAARDAIAHYESARAVGGDAQRLRHLYAQLGRAYELALDYAQARSAYAALLASARADQDAPAECLALNHLADLAMTEHLDLPAHGSLLQCALAVAERSDDGPGLVETEWNLSRHHFFRLDAGPARAYAERSLARARALGLTEQVARNLNWLALTTPTLQGTWRDAHAYAAEARAIYAALGDRVMEADSLVQLAVTGLGLGELPAGLAAARAAQEICREIDNTAGLGGAAIGLAEGLLDAGEYPAALAAAAEGADSARRAGWPPPLFMDVTLLGIAHRRLGQLDEAIAAHREALALAERMSWAAFVGAAAGELCADYAVAGDWATAAAYARQALTTRSYPGLVGGWSRWYETEALLHAGAAAEAADDARRFGERIGDSRRLRIPYLRALAALSEGSNDLPRAIEQLQEARDLAGEIGLPGELWPIQLRLGECYRRRGDETEAGRSLARARGIVQDLARRIPDEQRRAAFLAASAG